MLFIGFQPLFKNLQIKRVNLSNVPEYTDQYYLLWCCQNHDRDDGSWDMEQKKIRWRKSQCDNHYLTFHRGDSSFISKSPLDSVSIVLKVDEKRYKAIKI